MAKRISQLTTADMLKEMSIAGSPEKVVGVMTEIHDLMAAKLDLTNPAELLNIEFALQRLQAEVKTWLKLLERKNNQKYL